MPAWCMSYAGRYVDLLYPKPEDFDLRTVAHCLSGKPRFCGHSGRREVVAEHCVLCSMIVPPEFALHALWHEGDEVHLPDFPGPLKHTHYGVELAPLRARHQAAASVSIGLMWTARAKRAVDIADAVMLATEARALFGVADPQAEPHWNCAYPPTDEVTVECWPDDIAEKRFIERFFELKGAPSR